MTRHVGPSTLTKAERATGSDRAPDWLAGGAKCLDADADQFHPLGFSKAEQAQMRATIAHYCRPCPMRDTCYAWGRKMGRGQGIWGGERLDGPEPRQRRRAS
jgi:hypothetical protein